MSQHDKICNLCENTCKLILLISHVLDNPVISESNKTPRVVTFRHKQNWDEKKIKCVHIIHLLHNLPIY